jgi:hypothetical protein
MRSGEDRKSKKQHEVATVYDAVIFDSRFHTGYPVFSNPQKGGDDSVLSDSQIAHAERDDCRAQLRFQWGKMDS